MQLKPNYKNTEIGIIPQDWEVKTYDEVFLFLATATYSRAELTEIDEVSYVHYGDIHTKYNFFLDFAQSNLPTVRNEQVKNYHFLKDGDIIMADASEDYSGIGKSVEVKNLGSIKAISGLHTFLFRDKKGTFVAGFKAYIHFNQIVKAQFDRLATGLKVYGVSKGNLKTVKIPIPTLAEQTAIAAALSDADALISSLEVLIDKKRNIKQGAMQKLLNYNSFDLYDENNLNNEEKKVILQNQNTHHTEKWEVRKLGEIAEINMGQSPLSVYYNSEGIGLPLVQGNADIKNRKTIIRFYTSMITKKGKSGDIIMSVRAPVGDISKATFDCCLGRGVCSISFGNEYLYHYLIYFEKSWTKLSTGSTFDSVNSKQVKELEIPIPQSKDEQVRIAGILSDMDVEIGILEEKLEKYKDIKMGMMQNLLTGAIRLV